MIVETKSEREARGHPVGHDGVPYQAMGGITGFSSLADGYMRLDPSGRGEYPATINVLLLIYEEFNRCPNVFCTTWLYQNLDFFEFCHAQCTFNLVHT